MIGRVLDRFALWSLYRGILFMQKHRGVGRGDVRFQQSVIDRWKPGNTCRGGGEEPARDRERNGKRQAGPRAIAKGTVNDRPAPERDREETARRRGNDTPGSRNVEVAPEPRPSPADRRARP